MKAVVINQYGSKEVLEEAEVTLPELSEHQVLVKEYATSINPIDWKLREGYLKQMFDLPLSDYSWLGCRWCDYRGGESSNGLASWR